MSTMKVGDLKPDLQVACTSNGVAVDLTTATSVQVVCRKEYDTVALWTRTASGSAGGIATYTWQAGDTATAGRLLFEVKVTWPSAKPQRFPENSYLAVDVVPNLD